MKNLKEREEVIEYSIKLNTTNLSPLRSGNISIRGVEDGIEGFDEKGNVKKIQIYPKKSKAMNLAFDVTPAKYVTGFITERGISEASFDGLSKLFK